jgi:predicted enzyme related to lactoylglutathione lyase
MERVTGIGGLFFRARDPKALKQWYAEYLGVAGGSDGQPWEQAAGATVLEPFPESTDYFGDPAQKWMINFRVRDLDAMMEQLRNAGIAVELAGDYEYGRFARLRDPEGNPIELWEPR